MGNDLQVAHLGVPTTRPTGVSRRRHFMPCPDCGDHRAMVRRLHYHTENLNAGGKDYEWRYWTVGLKCSQCGAVWSENFSH